MQRQYENEAVLIDKRRSAGLGALRFFKEIRTVKSANNYFASVSDTDIQNFCDRMKGRPDSVMNSFDASASTGVGNCDEKGRMCYASLISNPLIMLNSKVSYCASIGYDHAFVVVADYEITSCSIGVSDLGRTAMIVDGWTEDCYFPNLGWSYFSWSVPNPRQLYVRNRIRNHQLQYYGIDRAMPSLL